MSENIKEIRRGAEAAVNGLFVVYLHCRDAEIQKMCREVIDTLCERYQEKEPEAAPPGEAGE